MTDRSHRNGSPLDVVPLSNRYRPDGKPRSLVNLAPQDSCGVGFIASIHGNTTHEILQLALTSLANVAHRGALGADGKTGDGAGVTTTIPRKLVARWLNERRVARPAQSVGMGMIFVPDDPQLLTQAKQIVDEQARSMGLRVLGYRDVPMDKHCLGESAASSCPATLQIFLDAPYDDLDRFERELFLLRRGIELTPKVGRLHELYVCSMSCRTISYKGMVVATALADLYPDLKDPEYECIVSLFHQRYSTNTSPQWSLCQPFRMLAHNGEINTIRGNRNWMTAREMNFHHPFWVRHRERVKRIFSFNDSDSASLDNSVELLTLSGRSLLHSLAMLIPPAWENDPFLSERQEAFYQFHSCFCEPWDGPALVALTDGKFVAASLDRNGLRPARFKLTRDGVLSLGSEVGADRIDESRVVQKGRLGPGEMIAVDLENNQILLDQEIKDSLASQKPYQLWLKENVTEFQPKQSESFDEFDSLESPLFLRNQIAAGLTHEEIHLGLAKMAENGVEPTFSMGVDTPLAVLSKQPRNLADYFKQRFAQVTNPPIDPIRERLVMSLGAGLGPERNILVETPQHCRVFRLNNPILLPNELQQIEDQCPFGFQSIDCSWPKSQGRDGLKPALKKIIEQAQLAIESHVSVIVLSDRNVNKDRTAIPMLMVVGALHHALCKSGHRMMCSLIAETSSVRDPHQLALLFGYGCTAVYPYIAYGALAQLRLQEKLSGSLGDLFENYRAALSKGMLKIMSKMGISILNSYQGAQIFEAVGIGPDVIDTCFRYSFSNVDGIDFFDIADDCLQRHDAAFEAQESELKIEELGLSKPKRSGEHHVISGKVTKSVHQFVTKNEEQHFDDFQTRVRSENPVAIRDLFDFSPKSQNPIPVESAEPIELIRKRFTTAAMSLGAISPEAHEAIAIAMNQIGGKSNSGEGGEDPSRFTQRSDGTWANSKIKQIASGRFGVNATYLSSAEEIEIKMAQGAKPGEGGQLPGFKVNQLIARLRNTEPGVTLISPPPHHDIYSIEDLSQLIFDLKMVNPKARVCVKLVAKTGVGGIAVGVAKANADAILISGHEGGTGASPLTSIKHAGIPWELGLAEAHQSLTTAGLRNRVVLRVDGGMRTGRDIILAAILGAEEYNFGTMALIALGCVYVKKCHLNNCPVGIATQDPKFRAKFKGEPENLVSYLNAVATTCRKLLAQLGAKSMDEIIGQSQLLKVSKPDSNRKVSGIDLSAVLHQPANPTNQTPTAEKYAQAPQQLKSFDDQVIESLADQTESTFEAQVENTDRNIGTKLSGLFARSQRSVDHKVQLNLTGTAGQSLGAFLSDGVNIDLVGEANDYVGKGMSGGKIIIRPRESASYASQESVIAGNTILYGATGGKLFASGRVAERLCVRNSGAVAVVEGCGDHGCEYMTRGTLLVLGTVGINFAAGMTGGVAYVLDERSDLEKRVNKETVVLSELDDSDIEITRELLQEFLAETNSKHAKRLLDQWETTHPMIRKIAPKNP